MHDPYGGNVGSWAFQVVLNNSHEVSGQRLHEDGDILLGNWSAGVKVGSEGSETLLNEDVRYCIFESMISIQTQRWSWLGSFE